MTIQELNILRSIWPAIKEFFEDDGLDKSSVLAYYSIFSSLFLLTFFTYLFTHFLGDPAIAYKSVYPFSPEFLSKISPDIFAKAGEISEKIKDIGVVSVLLTFASGFLIIKKIVQYVNEMFRIKLPPMSDRHFVFRRISEFSLLFITGFLVIATFFISGIISTMTRIVHENETVSGLIDPGFIEWINTFLLLYVVPFCTTLLFFFILYKWIPEKAVYVRGALIAAILSSILWELVKRCYSYFLVNVSILGQIKGPIMAIILFGFWMELSMGIMLFGAKLTYILDKEYNDKLKTTMSVD